MSKLIVTINERGTETRVIVPNTTTDEAIDRLGNTEASSVQEFIERTGVILSVETPNSSWVDRISFNPASDELIFDTSDGAQISFNGTFADFQKALDADSAGKFYWRIKREADRGLR